MITNSKQRLSYGGIDLSYDIQNFEYDCPHSRRQKTVSIDVKCQHCDNNIPGCSSIVLDDPSIVYPFADENNASSINQQSIHSRTTTEFNNDSTMNFHAKNSNPEHFHQG